MITSRTYHQAHLTAIEVAQAMIDMTYHTAEGKVDVTQVYKDTYKKWTGVDPLESSHFPASCTQIMGSYQATIYGKLWSRIYAQDLFSRFKKEGPLNSSVGLAFQKEVYERGSLVDPEQIVRDFLGRESSSHAFYSDPGLQTND